MMNLSRRQLARYAVEQLLAHQPPATISKYLAAALVACGKPKEADPLLDDIAQELENRGLLAEATSISASELSDKLRVELKSAIAKAANVKEVSLREVVDEDVIGGVRIETANHTWDKTIAQELADIKGGING